MESLIVPRHGPSEAGYDKECCYMNKLVTPDHETMYLWHIKYFVSIDGLHNNAVWLKERKTFHYSGL